MRIYQELIRYILNNFSISPNRLWILFFEKIEKIGCKDFNWFVFCRYLSQYYSMIPYLDVINTTKGISDETKFYILRDAIKSHSREFNIEKNGSLFKKKYTSIEANLLAISEHEQISLKKARKARGSLSVADLLKIKSELEKGGKEKTKNISA